ncbi:MAG: UpxY family transcription antiterminator [Prevotellaceae bacterium]|jgi:transcription antitermination factor NusG|nr:UpxY family transcription antiterminator [Prevotellaceae bacterium]
MEQETINTNHWYALRITYSREMALKEFLDAEGIGNFIPMHYDYIRKGEHRVRRLVPVVHNLIFIYSTRQRLDVIKKEQEYRLPMRYIMNAETRQPIVVPIKQMESFIAVAGTYDEQVVYLSPEEITLRKGMRVRINGGPFEGVEGVLMRVKNDRRVVVSIKGVMAVATHFIHPSLVTPIPEDALTDH